MAISTVRQYKNTFRLLLDFSTNAFLANVPNISIMQITGHNTEKAFMKYIRVSGEDNARRLLLHPHFSKNSSIF